jgi:hypothetical protein
MQVVKMKTIINTISVKKENIWVAGCNNNNPKQSYEN